MATGSTSPDAVVGAVGGVPPAGVAVAGSGVAVGTWVAVAVGAGEGVEGEVLSSTSSQAMEAVITKENIMSNWKSNREINPVEAMR